MYLLTTIGLAPGGSITAYIYTQTIHRTTIMAKLSRIKYKVGLRDNFFNRIHPVVLYQYNIIIVRL